MNYIYRFPEKGQSFNWRRDDGLGLLECFAWIDTHPRGDKAFMWMAVLSRYNSPKEQFQSKIDEAWNQFPGGYDGSCKEMASIKGLHMTVESGLGQLTLRDAPTWLVKKMSDYLVPSIFEISQRQCASNLETDPIFEVRT
jgi:hypothetical protein